MLSNDEAQRLARLVRLAPYMDQEQREALLKMIRELNAADSIGGPMPQSAVDDLARAVPDQLVRDIVNDFRHGPGVPGWLPPSTPSGQTKRGSGWHQPPKPEDRSRQFEQF